MLGSPSKKRPAVARRPQRGFAAQVHQLALAWRPGKVTGDAPFLGGDPRAICSQELVATQSTLRSSRKLPRFALSAQPEPLSGAASGEVQRSIWSIGLTFVAERPQISTFRQRNLLKLARPARF